MRAAPKCLGDGGCILREGKRRVARQTEATRGTKLERLCGHQKCVWSSEETAGAIKCLHGGSSLCDAPSYAGIVQGGRRAHLGMRG